MFSKSPVCFSESVVAFLLACNGTTSVDALSLSRVYRSVSEGLCPMSREAAVVDRHLTICFLSLFCGWRCFRRFLLCSPGDARPGERKQLLESASLF